MSSDPAGSSLDVVFESETIAIFGASEREGSAGAQVLQYLRNNGYPGHILPINPQRDKVFDLPCFPSIDAASDGKGVDQALVLLNRDLVLDAIHQCGKAGVKAASVFSAGWGEIDEPGRRRQEVLVRTAQGYGMRVLGPNCLGVLNVSSGLVASSANALSRMTLRPGGISIISQSGATAGYIMGLLADDGLGLRYVASTGNEADIKAGEVLEYVAEDPQTQVIVLYLEGLRDPDAFVRGLQRAHDNGKYVVVMKVGGTPVGAMAVQSHTAALAGDDAVFDAIFRATGAYRAQSLTEVVTAARLALGVQRAPRTPHRLAVFSTSGGSGVMAAESLAREGFELPVMPQVVQDRIRARLPFSSPINPIDLSAVVATDTSAFTDAIQASLEDDLVDGVFVCVTNTPRTATKFEGVKAALESAISESAVMFVVQGALTEADRAFFRDLGAETSSDPAQAGPIFRIRRELDSRRNRTSTVAPEFLAAASDENLSYLDEDEAIAALAGHGVTFPWFRALPDATALDSLEGLDAPYPLAVKRIEPGVVHKTERGFVRVGVDDPPALRDAVRDLVDVGQEPGRILVQEMVRDSSYELLVGTTVDANFGRIYVLALGGKLAEFLHRRTVLLPPLDREDVLRALGELGIDELLAGTRGDAPTNVNGIVQSLFALEQLVKTDARVRDAEINPLLIRRKDGEVVAVDAVVQVAVQPGGRGLRRGIGFRAEK